MFSVLKDFKIDYEKIPQIGLASGLGWDVENHHLKLYCFHDDITQIEDPSLRSLMAGYKMTNHHKFSLVSYTFNGSSLVEKKVYYYLKESNIAQKSTHPIKAIHTTVMLTDKRGAIKQLDVPHNGIDVGKLADIPQKIYKINQKVYRPLDTITYGAKDEVTLYF